MEFSTEGLRMRFRGYDPREVDAALKAKSAEISQLKAKLEVAEAALQRLAGKGATLGETLLIAQRAAQETKDAAQVQADEMLAAAKRAIQDEQARSKTALEEIRWEAERLRLEKQKFISSFRSLLETYLGELAEANRGLSVVDGDATPSDDGAANA